MDRIEKLDKVMDALADLDWSDDSIPEIMEGFYNRPIEAIEQAQGEISDSHLDYLWDTLELEEDDED